MEDGNLLFNAAARIMETDIRMEETDIVHKSDGILPGGYTGLLLEQIQNSQEQEHNSYEEVDLRILLEIFKGMITIAGCSCAVFTAAAAAANSSCCRINYCNKVRNLNHVNVI